MDAEHDELVPLGEGPAATVLAGVDESTGEGFALKVYPGSVDRRTRSQLDKELGAAASLRTLGTVLVPDGVGELPDGRLAVRMELCAQSLPELVDAFGPLSIADALALGEALSTALAAAHQAGLVHGGVTPGNVLFRASGAPVLSDFGVALRVAFPRDPGRGVAFLAPETVGDGTADERTDLYGLGAILYLALSGKAPHQGRPGEQPDELTLRVLSGQAPPIERPDLPRGLAHLVSSLLEKNPDARPIDAALVASRLGSMTGPDLAGTAGTAGPPLPAVPRAFGEPILEYGPKQARPRLSGRARTTLLLTGAVAGVALIVVTGLVLRNRPPELALPPAPAGSGSAVPSSSSPKAVRIELADPVDRVDYVELTWHSTEPLQFAVIVAPEGQERRTVYVQQAMTYRLPVDPERRYCFLVQGTDKYLAYESPAKGIRKAVCTQ